MRRDNKWFKLVPMAALYGAESKVNRVLNFIMSKSMRKETRNKSPDKRMIDSPIARALINLERLPVPFSLIFHS
jgi:hypothetical protein